ncbi:MAG TPA: hypothetical protein VLB27_00235, partial [candidate division Zixibacteria bacterium]|nr:hypothetical protein [candidate division Zixibacteria bacterium]
MFLRELDDDGGRHDLVRTQEIVDINSRIEVRLDKTAIGARLADRLDLPGFSDDDLADMVKLQTLSQRGFDALPKVLAAIRSWQSAPYDVNAFEEKMDAAAQVIIELQFAFPEGHPFTEGLNPRMESAIGPDGNIPVEDQYRLVFEEARDYAAVLNARLHDALAQQAVTVMLGAWLRTEDHNVPLHLDGFDDYPA